MPSKRRYRCYLEPATSSHKVPRQKVWIQQKKHSSAAASQFPAGKLVMNLVMIVLCGKMRQVRKMTF
ncbi:hypothetical protein HPB50_028719 [Hyalomma asiaticum]|nr:hypothetical protein HPB50_028719 [Hyalomma asiaticum]